MYLFFLGQVQGTRGRGDCIVCHPVSGIYCDPQYLCRFDRPEIEFSKKQNPGSPVYSGFSKDISTQGLDPEFLSHTII